MSDLNVPRRWGDRFESLVGKRRDAWMVVGLLGCIVLAVVSLRLRTPPARVAPPAIAVLPNEATETPLPTTEILVHVSGEVRKPGLISLPDGSRVADAIEAAGGATPQGDVDAVNLAEIVADGAKIEVPRRGESRGVAAVPTDPAMAASPTSTIVNVNTADPVALEAIPGIGPVLASAIVQHRDDNGPFPSVDALLEVSGIGPATLESIRAYVAV